MRPPWRWLSACLVAAGISVFGLTAQERLERRPSRPNILFLFPAGADGDVGGMSDHTEVPVRDLDADSRLLPPRTVTTFSSKLFADSAIDFLKGHSGPAPFFAYVAFTAPHDPRQPPPEDPREATGDSAHSQVLLVANATVGREQQYRRVGEPVRQLSVVQASEAAKNVEASTE